VSCSAEIDKAGDEENMDGNRNIGLFGIEAWAGSSISMYELLAYEWVN